MKKPYVLKKAILTHYSGKTSEWFFEKSEIQTSPKKILEEKILDELGKQKMKDPAVKCDLIVNYI